MTELTVVEKKNIALDILMYFDKLCKTHSFDYCLAYGTLLGAVRHKGFIPWDDDIDVWVPYEIFEDLMTVLKDDGKYTVLNGFEGGQWGRPFSKLCDKTTSSVRKADNAKGPGVAIDIFPLLPCDKNMLKKYTYYSKMMTRTFLYETGHYNSVAKKAAFKLLGLFGKKHSFYSKKLVEYTKKSKGLYYFSPAIYGQKDFHAQADFEAAEMDFEGLQLKVPRGWDNVLRNIYGDYMQLPPIEKRVAPHDEIFYRD